MLEFTAATLRSKIDANPSWPADLIDKAERAFIIVQQKERGTFKSASTIMREENNKDLTAFAVAMEAHMKGQAR